MPIVHVVLLPGPRLHRPLHNRLQQVTVLACWLHIRLQNPLSGFCSANVSNWL